MPPVGEGEGEGENVKRPHFLQASASPFEKATGPRAIVPWFCRGLSEDLLAGRSEGLRGISGEGEGEGEGENVKRPHFLQASASPFGKATGPRAIAPWFCRGLSEDLLAGRSEGWRGIFRFGRVLAIAIVSLLLGRLPLLSVDVFSVSHPDDKNNLLDGMGFIDNSVISQTEASAALFASFEKFSGMRIFREEIYAFC